MLIGIAAASLDNVIGRAHQIPWNIPEEMKFFKLTTMGHTLVMGRKTFDSVGYLQGRTVKFLSRKSKNEHDMITLEETLELSKTEDVYICGGSEIYKLFMPYMDVFLVSRVPVNVPDGDTFLPEIVGFNDPIEIKLEKFTVESYFRKLI